MKTLQGKQITLLLFLRRNLQVNSPKIKTLAYFGLVRPLLEYAATVWDPKTDINISKIETVQRRAARFAVSNHNRAASIEVILDELGWKSPQSRTKKSNETLHVEKAAQWPRGSRWNAATNPYAAD